MANQKIYIVNLNKTITGYWHYTVYYRNKALPDKPVIYRLYRKWETALRNSYKRIEKHFNQI